MQGYKVHIHTTLGYTGKDLATPHTTYEQKEILSKTILQATLCSLQLLCCPMDKDCSTPEKPGRE